MIQRPDEEVVISLRTVWKQMSSRAQSFSLNFEYEPRLLGCLIEAIAVESGLDDTISPKVAPRLPVAAIQCLRESWARVSKDNFGEEFFRILYSDQPNDSPLKDIFDHPVARPSNVSKVIEALLNLLDADDVPRLERVSHAIVMLASHFGNLKACHLGIVKRSIVRAVTSFAPSGEKRQAAQCWEGLLYGLAAVAAPVLFSSATMPELTEATAVSMPIPHALYHAGMLGANGSALMEMCLGVSAQSQGGQPVPSEAVVKLREARAWLVELASDDVNAYCALLGCVFTRPSEAAERSGGEDQLHEFGERQSGDDSEPLAGKAERAERRRWLRRKAEVPLRIAEMILGAASTCLSDRTKVRKSLHPDWVAGVAMLRGATDIAIKDVSLNMKYLSNKEGTPISTDNARTTSDFLARLARVQEANAAPPWEQLCDVS